MSIGLALQLDIVLKLYTQTAHFELLIFMSENSEIDIDYIAKLARLDLDAAERCTLKDELEGILEHFEKLNTVDVTGVEPMAHAHSVLNVWREGDQAQPTLSAEEVCQLAPATREGQVVVPKVVE